MDNLDIVDAIYNPGSLHERVQKDLDERRLLIKQMKQTTNEQRAAVQEMQKARRLAAEDVDRADMLTKDALQLMETVQIREREATELGNQNRQKEIELKEFERSLNEREHFIIQRQNHLDQTLNHLRTLVN
jgi:hypothetical protein